MPRKIMFTKSDQLIWQKRHPEIPAEFFAKGFTGTMNGKKLDFIPANTAKNAPALKAVKDSAGYKEYCATENGTQVTLTV